MDASMNHTTTRDKRENDSSQTMKASGPSFLLLRSFLSFDLAAC
jgi:hypothetical protein